MEKVIGLGEFGCGIAEEFSEYPEYRVYKIGTNLPHKGNLVVDVQETIKDYEDNNIPQPTETNITNILLPSLFGTGVFGTSQFGGSTDPMVRKTITGSGHAANFRIRSNDQKSAYAINGMYIDYVPSGRR